MSVLSAYFDSSVNQCSPVRPDYTRVVNYDENGNEFISYHLVDYPALQKANGSISDWSLESLLKAGVSPDFPIRTSFCTRLEGVGIVNQFVSEADKILSSDVESDSKE